MLMNPLTHQFLPDAKMASEWSCDPAVLVTGLCRNDPALDRRRAG